MNDLDYLYAHHAVGVCPEERCVTARANLAALLEGFVILPDACLIVSEAELASAIAEGYVAEDGGEWLDDALQPIPHVMARDIRAALQGRVASREGSGT
jgi:hypothetical protein